MARKLPKLAFFRAPQSITLPAVGLSYQSGVPNSNDGHISEHFLTNTLVGNSGNMIHRMAMVQMVNCDRHHSSQINIFKLIKKAGSPKLAAKKLNGRFDGVVITLANILRRGAQEPGIGELVRNLRIPVYCVGMGLQDDLPEGDFSDLNPNVVDLVRALDEHAVLFGTRGDRTLAWLRTIGVKNAKSIGCPSMFAYPRNTLSISAPERTEKIMTAGHLSLTSNQDSSGQKLMKGLSGKKAAYVFQSETSVLKRLEGEPLAYNEASQTLNHDMVSKLIHDECKVTPPFSKYYSFSEVSAWRQAALQYDLYAGDRIHGGVAAMQVGQPALVLHADTRVQELTSHHGIPSCSLDEFAKIGVDAAVEKYLNEQSISDFHEVYRGALANFEHHVNEAGLSLLNRL
ncbi:polysaccharide pyruvyl transferase family protein [Falsihalocynthiibacter sp. SS001]|uniref:polysaccharide pyruvyl transferase family protein n=1 Tax=Falsihalocynthiibacter sp. SS001 TaxID=3349698 RepID=UPI0036D41ED5